MMTVKTIASGSSGNCYYISDGLTNLLIECGITFKKIQQGVGFKMSEISGVLISHEHADHCKAMKDCLRAGITCYTSEGTVGARERLLVTNRIKTISAHKQFKIGTWTILPFDIVHDCVEPLGFLLVSGKYKVLYASDTAYIKYKFKGLTHILIESNYQDDILQQNIDTGIVEYGLKERLLKTHMSLTQVVGFLKANDLSRVEEIHLIHISSRNADVAQMREIVINETGKPVYI